jgi:two-component system nitrogen regulation sensor histidine kinase NtrY
VATALVELQGMLRRPNFRSLRGRLFLALFLTAALPAGLLMVGGALVIREVVVGTGTAGPWDEVATSGRELLTRIEDDPNASPELRAAAERHRAQLSESLRFSRLYAYLGERVLFLLPAVAGGLFVLAAALSLWSAKQVSRSLSRPVHEIVRWTEALGQGRPLPPDPPGKARREIREVRALRDGLRSMESELARARARELREARNRSWSEMARRIAHDLKNPLTPMQMAATTVSRSSDPAAAEAGRVLLDEIARLDELSRSFSHFGRPPEGPPSPVELGELLEHLRQRVDPSGDRVEWRLPPGETFVLGHPVALERVVRNLVVNALDAHAAREGADPSHRCAPARVSLLRHEPHASTGQSAAEIVVEDRGPGLPEGARDRIWEPDFTTKRRGTGLGLPLVRQVVEAHEGSVAAESRQGGGARFRVLLPLDPGGPGGGPKLPGEGAEA